MKLRLVSAWSNRHFLCLYLRSYADSDKHGYGYRNHKCSWAGSYFFINVGPFTNKDWLKLRKGYVSTSKLSLGYDYSFMPLLADLAKVSLKVKHVWVIASIMNVITYPVRPLIVWLHKKVNIEKFGWIYASTNNKDANICFLKSIQYVNDSQTPRTLGSMSTRYRPDTKVWDRYLINVDSRVFAFWIKDAVIKYEIIRHIVLAPKMKSKWVSFTTNKTMCAWKLILKTSIDI